jgi:hypothetical protein
MMESALFRLNTFATCARTVSAINRVWKSWSDLFRHQHMTHAIVRRVGDFAIVSDSHGAAAGARAVH